MSTATPKKTEHQPLFDIVRGLAILWIVYFHGTRVYFSQYPGWLKWFLENGYLGIDLFLIVSGFVIAASIEKTLKNNLCPFNFIKKRAVRVFVPFWCSVLFTAVIIPWLAGLSCRLQNIGLIYRTPQLTAVEWIQSLTLTKIFWAKSWSLSEVYMAFNAPVWFLSVILQIYLLLAVALAFRKYFTAVIISVTALSALCIVPSFFKHVPYGLFLPFWPSFVLGMFVHHLTQKKITISMPAKNRILPLAVYTLVLVLPFAAMAISRIAFNLLSAAAILLLLPIQGKIYSCVTGRFLAWVGTFSYSLYLTHISFHSLFHIVFYRLISLDPPLLTPLLIIPLVILSAFAWSLVFEKPGVLSRGLAPLNRHAKT